MTTLGNVLTKEHKECDEIFASIEDSVADKNWAEAMARLTQFLDSTLLHLQKEQEILFPAFESATGMTSGPTAMMRMEHEQMRGLFANLKTAVENQSEDEYAGVAESLHILMQQHNMKEEQMLYPMCEQHLSDETVELIEKMNSL